MLFRFFHTGAGGRVVCSNTMSGHWAKIEAPAFGKRAAKGKHQVQKHWMQHRWVCWPLFMSPCFGCHQCLQRYLYWCESKLQHFELSGPPYKSTASRFSHHNFLSTASRALILCVRQRPVHRAPGGQRGGSFQPPWSPLSNFSCPELSNPPSPCHFLL